ncbi:hypothetical protein [Nesterenkonia sp. CF4.4]|uniref:hypothetical protein n=1 Tax=Nesterenkonia sp. CF4.4 TaxID=3373079 RepID=UPI003EE77EB8
MNDQARKPSNLSRNLAYQSMRDSAPTGDLVDLPPTQPLTPTPAPAPVAKKPERKQVTYYHEENALARAKQAYEFTRVHTGHKSWTAFVEAAVDKLTYDLEEKHNDRRPFGS